MSDDRMRASDAERDAVVQILNTAYGAGRITADEHEERVDAALAARTLGDLRPLTLDLVPSASPGPRPEPPRGRRPPVAEPGRTVPTGPRQVIGVTLDKLHREGPWRVPPRLRINGFVATIDLDLTEAEFSGHILDIDVNLIMTSLRLRVPSGSNVQDRTSRFLGEQSVRRVGRYDERAPLILLGGNVTVSEIKVRGPRGQHGLLGAFGF